MIHCNGFFVSQVSSIELLTAKYKKHIANNFDQNPFSSEVIISGIVLSVKFKTIHSRNNNIIGLLEMSLVDECCALNPVLYQCWGQNATDKFRYLVMRGCSVTIGNITVSQRAESPYVIRGDIICVRGGLVSSPELDRDAAHYLSPALRQSLTRLENWADAYPLTSLIRRASPSVAAASSLVDVAQCCGRDDVLLFDIPLLLGLEGTPQGEMTHLFSS
jgi:hypothetical protein